jgi:hypothetical protein
MNKEGASRYDYRLAIDAFHVEIQIWTLIVVKDAVAGFKRKLVWDFA